MTRPLIPIFDLWVRHGPRDRSDRNVNQGSASGLAAREATVRYPQHSTELKIAA